MSTKLIFERSQAGRRGVEVPRANLPVPEIPEELARKEPPRLPEVAEPEVLRHFTELSNRNFGIDTGFYPLGSCTMKYNPRVNERAVALPGFRDLHPLQEDEGAQGALELMAGSAWTSSLPSPSPARSPPTSVPPCSRSRTRTTPPAAVAGRSPTSGRSPPRRASAGCASTSTAPGS